MVAAAPRFNTAVPGSDASNHASSGSSHSTRLSTDQLRALNHRFQTGANRVQLAEPATLDDAIAAAMRSPNLAGSAIAGKWIYPGGNFAIVRFALPNGHKSYRPFHRGADGSWRAGDPDGPLALFGADSLPTAGPIYVVEGEKCCDRARELGLVAVTSSHGSNAAAKSDWTPLAGREIIILPDRDTAGEKFAAEVTKICIDQGCRVRIVRLPDLPPCGDVADFRPGVDPAKIKLEIETLASAAPYEIGSPMPAMQRPPRANDFIAADHSKASPGFEAAKQWIATAEPAVSGERGHDVAFATACQLFRFGLSAAEAQELFDEYNRDCDPPWSKREIDHKLLSAERTVRESGEFGILARSEKPGIVLGTDEFRVADEIIDLGLRDDPEIFYRGGMLARIIRDSRDDGITRAEGTPTIVTVNRAWLRERISGRVMLIKRLTKKDKTEDHPAHPPAYAVDAILARAEWPKLRPLRAISNSPVLRPDGSIHQSPGYDPETRVIFAPVGPSVPVPERATRDDAIAAAKRLMGVASDFRFDKPEHGAGWLAGVLTPAARHAFAGPSPAFVVDANVRGAGKGLLVQVAAAINTGRPIPVCGYAHDPAELTKKITSVLIAGDPLVLLDNVHGDFGNDALDRALTAERWQDRILGVSQMVNLPLLTIWFATGNNIMVAADTARRIIHIRLDVLSEKPEERSNFAHPLLLKWVRENRASLLADAMTVLSAYLKVGKPDQKLTPFGSFEGWSELVRSSIVWAGQADPCETRKGLMESCDSTTDVLRQFIQAIRLYDPERRGFTVADLIDDVYTYSANSNPHAGAVRSALEALSPPENGGKPKAPKVGKKLQGFKRRVMDGSFIDVDAGSGRRNGNWWKLVDVD